MTEQHEGYGKYLEELSADLAEAAQVSEAAIAQAELEAEAAEAAQNDLSPLDRYTAAFQALKEFEIANGFILSELDTLQRAKAEAEEALKVHARQIGDHDNDLFQVIVQVRSGKSYDGNLLLERAPWLQSAGVCMPRHTVEVDAKKLDALVKKGILAWDVLDGAVTEKPLTPAVLIRAK